MANVGDRLKNERNRLNFNQIDFSEKCGIKRGTQISYEQNKNKPDSDYLTSAYKLGVDIHYVLTGERIRSIDGELTPKEKLHVKSTLYMHNNDPDAGDEINEAGRPYLISMDKQLKAFENMLQFSDPVENNIIATTLFHALEEGPESLVQKKELSLEKITDAINIINNQISNSTDDLAMIPGYNVQVSAGHGVVNDNETPTRHLAFRKKWLQYRGFKPTDLVVVFTKGDSMEPTISNNDSLLIHTKVSNILDGKIYVIRQDETLLVKRVQRLLDGNIKLISDNKAYEPMVLSKDSFESLDVVGQVVWIAKDIS